MKSSSPRILAIDDCREWQNAHILARTYFDGLKALTKIGPWDTLYLDHDLGALESQKDGTREFTGWDIMLFLYDNPQYIPNEIKIVTANPAARPKMEDMVKKLEALRFQYLRELKQ